MRTSLTTRYDYIPVGTVWPSGDFSVGSKRVDWHGPHGRDKRTMQQAYDESQVGQWTEGALRQREQYGNRPGGWAEALDAEGFWSAPVGPEGADAPLNLTDAPNSHKAPNRPKSYGRQGMTGYGKKMVRSACALLERRYKGRLTFATVTMPSLPPELRQAMAECWPEFVRQALQWLGRQLQRQGLPKAVCSVTEIQTARLQAGNGGYLHLHMVWPNRRSRKGCWAVDVLAFRSWCESFWIRRGIWEDGAWVNVNTQRVEVSAAAYLSKYMSKGGESLDAFVDESGWGACPGQWWNLTKPLRDAVKAEVVKGQAVGEWINAMVEYALEFCDGSAFWSLRTVDMEYDGRFITVGYCGILKAEHQRYARDSFRDNMPKVA